jgi:hypothetical protein
METAENLCKSAVAHQWAHQSRRLTSADSGGQLRLHRGVSGHCGGRDAARPDHPEQRASITYV